MRLILYTGSGGAGTTTLTAATAQALGAAGHRVLVGALEDVADLADCLAERVPGHRSAGLRTAPGDVPPQRRDHAAGVTMLPESLGHPRSDWGHAQELLLTALSRAGLDAALAEEAPLLPGLGPVRAVFRLLEVFGRDDADVCVLDLGSWGSAAELLTLPGQLVWLLQRLIVAPTGLASTLRPLALLLGQRAGVTAMGIARALAEAETTAHVLRSDQTRLRLVVRPGPGQASRLARRLPELTLAGARVELLVLNNAATVGDGLSRGRSAAATAGSVGPVGDLLDADLLRVLPGMTVLRVPDAAIPDAGRPGHAAGAVGVVDREMGADCTPLTAARVAARVAQSATGLASLDHTATSLAPRIDTTDEGYRLAIRVPLGEEDGVRVQRRQDDLLISIGGRRHLLPLAGALRRCQVTGAACRDGELQVGFRPEESRWLHGD
ncbi:MAG TPA: ArsA-related P-loop ATPase [Dermatophilaceae bacterium]|nr:ArsA-related P-loop ATPase [Dermatophilaceae bacterium]